jgi:hypothetical protein
LNIHVGEESFGDGVVISGYQSNFSPVKIPAKVNKIAVNLPILKEILGFK